MEIKRRLYLPLSSLTRRICWRVRDDIARDRGHLDKGGALLNLHPLIAAPIVEGEEKQQ